MHEMGLAEGILEVALEAAGGQPIARVAVQVGKALAVAPESLEFSFRLAAAETPAAEAVLAIEEIPIRARCRTCAAESELDGPPLCCRSCGGAALELVAGQDLWVDRVELENRRVISRPAAERREPEG